MIELCFFLYVLIIVKVKLNFSVYNIVYIGIMVYVVKFYSKG